MPVFEPIDHDPWAEGAPPAPDRTLRFTLRPRRRDDVQGAPGVADPGSDPTAAALAEYMRQVQGAAPPGATHEAEKPNPALPYLEAVIRESIRLHSPIDESPRLVTRLPYFRSFR